MPTITPITHIITMDLERPCNPPVIHVKQGEIGSRLIQVDFVCRGSEWEAPEGYAILAGYRRRDGSGAAYTSTSNVICEFLTDRTGAKLSLPPEAVSSPGVLEMDLSICNDIDESTWKLTTFSWLCIVHPSAAGASSIIWLSELRSLINQLGIGVLYLYADSNDPLPETEGETAECSPQGFAGGSEVSTYASGDYVVDINSGCIARITDTTGQTIIMTGTGLKLGR